MTAAKALFLDRDGVIIKDTGFVGSPQSVRLLPKAALAINLAHRHGYLAIVISNQSGVGRGFFSEDDLSKVEQEIARRLARKGAYVDDVYHCPHHPEAVIAKYRTKCVCRKPEPGMILEAQKKYQVDLSSSFMIGDSERDVEAALRSGVRPILIQQGEKRILINDIPTARSLYDAVAKYVV